MNYSEFKTKYAISLNPQQEAAVQAVNGPVLLLAVPGSGKTTTLVTRLGYMVLCQNIPPEQILTTTYTVAATGDMRNRFASLFGQALAERLEFRTINGVSARIIRYYEYRLGRKAFELVANERDLITLISEIYRGITREFATESTIKTIRTWITYIKNMQLPDAEIDTLKADDVKIGPIYREYFSKRIIAFDNEGRYMVMFNPEIVKCSAPYEAEEGCLSLAGVQKTKRYSSIKVQYQNEKFQTRLKTFTGWTAQIIQHEIDHCNGVLI